jgi:hypothetical protein
MCIIRGFWRCQVICSVQKILGARSSIVGWGTMLQAGRSPVRVPDKVDFFNLPNPSNRTMALGSTQPLTEMSTRIFLGVKSGWRLRLITLPPSASRMPKNVGSSTSRNPKGLHGLYRDSFAFRAIFYFIYPEYRLIQISKGLLHVDPRFASSCTFKMSTAGSFEMFVTWQRPPSLAKRLV